MCFGEILVGLQQHIIPHGGLDFHLLRKLDACCRAGEGKKLEVE